MHTFAINQELYNIGMKAPAERLNQKHCFQIKYLFLLVNNVTLNKNFLESFLLVMISQNNSSAHS